MTKDKLFEIFDKYDTYDFNENGESIHSIKWADLNGLADELVKLFAIPVVSNQRELLIGYSKIVLNHNYEAFKEFELKRIDEYLANL